MKILLTGGSGFIGKNIRESYLAKKYEIIAPTSSELNLLSQQSVDEYFENNSFDIIIHSACKPGHRNAKDPTGIFYANTKMFFNLLSHKNRYQKFINIGSGAIYDFRNYAPKMKEEHAGINIPEDEHGFCKYVINEHMAKLDNFYDLRVFGIFGKYEEYPIRFISNAICKSIYDLPITIKQNRKFDYLWIDDLMPVLEFFIENSPDKKSYNITPDNSIELVEIAKMVKEITGNKNKIEIANSGMGLEYSGDNSRLKNEIKNINFTEFEECIRQLHNYYLQNKGNIDYNLLLKDK